MTDFRVTFSYIKGWGRKSVNTRSAWFKYSTHKAHCRKVISRSDIWRAKYRSYKCHIVSCVLLARDPRAKGTCTGPRARHAARDIGLFHVEQMTSYHDIHIRVFHWNALLSSDNRRKYNRVFITLDNIALLTSFPLATRTCLTHIGLVVYTLQSSRMRFLIRSLIGLHFNM